MSALPRTFTSVSGSLIESVAKLPAKVETFSDRALSALQRNLLEILAPSAATPIVAGNLFREVAFVAGENTVIQHRLGRAFVDVIVCVPSAATAIPVGSLTTVTPAFVRVAQTAALDERQVTLTSFWTCTASVYVF